jgi:UDPglucose 6-dehydrogenase
MEPEITIYGFGYVGRAAARFLENHFRLQIVDPNPDTVRGAPKSAAVVSDRSNVLPTPYAIVAVPTAPRSDGSCDTSVVEEVIRNSEHDYYLIKSTVVPETTARLVTETGKRIAFSPEFIGEGRYHIPHWRGYPHPTDMSLHEFHIFGGERHTTGVWVSLWQRVAGWAPAYRETDSTTAEVVKYAENAYLAAQKMFYDALYDLSGAAGSNYNEVRELLLLDGRMSPALSVIYPESRGFSGKCLPKDLRAITRYLEKKGADPHFFRAILTANEKFRKDSKT